MDILVVGLGLVTLVGGDGVESVSVLRTFRVLRPLRAIKTVKPMRTLVNALLASLPNLLDVFLLFTFIIFVFGILGMQLFAGSMRFRCYSRATGDMDPAGSLCGAAPCPEGFFCADSGKSANNNVNGFDNIIMAWVTILQCISMEGWVDVMYGVRIAPPVSLTPSFRALSPRSPFHGFGNPPNLPLSHSPQPQLADTKSLALAVIYSHVLIFVGAMFVINLFTAVIFLRFQQSKEEEKENMLELLQLKNDELLRQDTKHMRKNMCRLPPPVPFIPPSTAPLPDLFLDTTTLSIPPSLQAKSRTNKYGS